MIRYSDALDLLQQEARLRAGALASVHGMEQVRLMESLGRTTAKELTSQELVPAFDNSAMDGFALRSPETHTATPERPIILPVNGTIAAGDPPHQASHDAACKDGCIEIMTGAPIPEGYDAVVKLEDVTVIFGKSGGTRQIELTRPLHSGENLRERGLDFAIGQSICPPGTRLNPEHLMALAAVGVTEVSVRKKPRVAVIATGSEIVDSGLSLQPGQIRNSSSPFLLASLPAMGAEARYFGRCGDDPKAFGGLLERALGERPDVIITTGAVSKGRHDFIPEAFKAAGARTVFHELAIRPGKPGFFAAFSDGPVVFGMPGNPVSTAVALRFFVGPYLSALLGQPTELPIRARLAAETAKPEGLRCFYKATLRFTEHGPEVSCHPGQPSFMVSPMLESNAWAVLPESSSTAPQGTWVDVYPLQGRFTEAAPVSQAHGGGCC